MSHQASRFDDEDDFEEHSPYPVERFRAGHGRQRRRHWGRWLLGFVVLMLLVVAVSVVWVQHQINPGRPGGEVAVTIAPNSSTASIASTLGKAGVIHDPTVFRFYIKTHGAGALLPGNYHLARNSSYDAVISALETGPPIVYQKFTIPEGFDLNQIAARVGSLPGRNAADVLAAANSGQVHSRYQPAGSNNLEGLLFPATYQVKADESYVAILQKMVTAFDDNAGNAGLDQAAVTLGMPPYQVVVVASMVEREAKLDEDRGPIASVIYNRLHKNMLLQIDATLLYGQGITDSHQIDKTSTNPYNTYKFKGLPPTPIASAGLPSLTAAAHPPTTNFIYYVLIDPSGKHGFAATASGFAKLEAEARSKGLL